MLSLHDAPTLSKLLAVLDGAACMVYIEPDSEMVRCSSQDPVQ